MKTIERNYRKGITELIYHGANGIPRDPYFQIILKEECEKEEIPYFHHTYFRCLHMGNLDDHYPCEKCMEEFKK